MNGLFTPEFVAALTGIVVSLVIALVPQLESVRTELVAVAAVLIGLVITALGGERAMAARSSGTTQAERASAAPPPVKPYVTTER